MKNLNIKPGKTQITTDHKSEILKINPYSPDFGRVELMNTCLRHYMHNLLYELESCCESLCSDKAKILYHIAFSIKIAQIGVKPLQSDSRN